MFSSLEGRRFACKVCLGKDGGDVGRRELSLLQGQSKIKGLLDDSCRNILSQELCLTVLAKYRTIINAMHLLEAILSYNSRVFHFHCTQIHVAKIRQLMLIFLCIFSGKTPHHGLSSENHSFPSTAKF